MKRNTPASPSDGAAKIAIAHATIGSSTVKEWSVRALSEEVKAERRMPDCSKEPKLVSFGVLARG